MSFAVKKMDDVWLGASGHYVPESELQGFPPYFTREFSPLDLRDVPDCQFTRLHIRRQNLEESLCEERMIVGFHREPTNRRGRAWICFGLCTQVETGRGGFSEAVL